MANTQFGKYQLIKKLATGGMAEVFLAKQSMGGGGDQRHVVVKRILPHLAEDPEFIQMFQNEARVAAKFSHPNIAQIFDYGQENGNYYIAMEFIRGEDLGRLMRKAWSTGQWIARPLAIRIVASCCEGLYYAHTRKDEEGRPLKVVHRDISPQNILISFDGSVKLVDFGIAKAADSATMTKSGAIKGKFAYMAPEQAAGKPLDARTDVFAIGLVLYELLSGVRPLKREGELATLQAALECAIEAPSQVADVPSELDEVVMRALAKAPDDRYKDARTFQMALEEFLSAQRMVASSVQVSELMETLFADRLAEEDQLGAPNPSSAESMSAVPPSVVAPDIKGQQRRRTLPEVTGGTESSPGPSHTGPGETGPEETGPGDTGEEDAHPWDAPAAPQVVPSRKYSGARGTAPSSTSNAEVSEPSRSRSGVRKSATAAVPRIETLGEDEPAPRRSSTGSPRLRTSATGSGVLAPAPPRKSRPQMEAVSTVALPKKPPRRPPPLSEAVVPQPMVERRSRVDSGASLGTRVMKVAVLLGACAVIAVGWLNRDLLSGKAVVGVPILLTVITNPKTRVTVVSPDPTRQAIDLGEGPIKASGAVVGDTIVMQNPEICLHYEETIQFGEPFAEKTIEKVFGEGTLMVTVNSNTKGLSVWCNGQRVGNLGMSFKAYEGKHNLEIRGDSLRAPVPFEAMVEKDKRGSIGPIDVSAALEK
jgi:serine/threonine protein kinase